MPLEDPEEDEIVKGYETEIRFFSVEETRLRYTKTRVYNGSYPRTPRIMHLSIVKNAVTLME